MKTADLEEVHNEDDVVQYITVTTFRVVDYNSTDMEVMTYHIQDPDHILCDIKPSKKDYMKDPL